MKLMSCVALAAVGTAGLYFKVEYSGWVLFIALLGFFCAKEQS